MDSLSPKKDFVIPAHISAHFRKQQRSGLSIRAYCIREKISVWSFYDWRKRYNKRLSTSRGYRKRHAKRTVSFQSLGTLPLHQSRFDLRFPSGINVAVYYGTTVEEIAPFITFFSGTVSSC